MKARPSRVYGPEVLALLDGRQTQMRRVVNPQPYEKYSGPPGADHWHNESEYHYRCAYGLPGDLLWCRETCRAEELGSGLDGVRYLADNTFREIDDSTEAAERWSKLRHYRGGRGEAVRSIHMPRWASRLTLRLTDVRIERVQDISEENAKAEGFDLTGWRPSFEVIQANVDNVLEQQS